MQNRKQLAGILKAELAFLERGGYRRGPRYPWRPNFVFEDSPTCINFAGTEERRPCSECALMHFVPQERQATRFPCRHIHLTATGETVNSFYEWGTEEELEKAVGEWLKRTIEQLESEEQERSTTA